MKEGEPLRACDVRFLPIVSCCARTLGVVEEDSEPSRPCRYEGREATLQTQTMQTVLRDVGSLSFLQRPYTAHD